MEKKSICVIGAYFGNLPAYINLWLKSCEYNPSIDFFIFGDTKPDKLPKNVRHIYMTLSDMKKLADEKLGMDTALNYPYKCCDFKVVYGIIFEDYVKNYDFWGHCDFDMIFGDLRKYFSNDILNRYDRILPLGHLSIYRNTDEVNRRYMADGGMTPYKKVFTSKDIYGFDEWRGIYRIYRYNNFPMYSEKVYADISRSYKRFKLALTPEFKNHTAFYWQNGKVFRTYYRFGKAKTDEYVYIHFKERGFKSTINDEGLQAFYIGPDGFTEKKDNKLPDRKTVDKINPYNAKEEFKKRIRYYIKGYLPHQYVALKDKYLR